MIDQKLNKEECKHKVVIENQKLVCEYCGETFKF